MHRLLVGVDRFQNGAFRSKQQLYYKLAQGQTPATLFITCSDSRVVPNLITSTEPGELFILRNAGNIIPQYEQGLGFGDTATIEYAVRALGVQHIVVCGHTFCGAMAGLITPGSCDDMPAVASWINHAREAVGRVQQRHGELPKEELLPLVIQENVRLQLENLQTHPAVRDALDNNAIELHGWVYCIASGKVDTYDSAADAFATFTGIDSVELSDDATLQA